MATDFIGKGNRELDEAAMGARSSAELRERILAVMQKQGTIALDPRDPTNVQPGIAPSTPAPAVPVFDVGQSGATESHMRVVYPHLNDRYEIYGVSEAALDAKEKQLRRMFGK